MTKAPVTAVVITKNEEAAIERCIRALDFCDQVLVIDSNSTDRTAQVARGLGAEVIAFSWNGEYPKKKQWGMDHPSVRNNWVLHIDADEVVSPVLAQEIRSAVSAEGPDLAAYEIPIAYSFMGRRLRFGHRVVKRCLVHRTRARFPEVGDLGAPGITEVEGHYQPECDGQTGSLSNRLLHEDPDPLSDWIDRHNRYSDWEAYLVSNPVIRSSVRERRTRGGRLFDALPFKPLVFFIYAYFLRLGFLDARPGLNYALALSWYYWLIGVKVRELNRAQAAPVGHFR
ncbi:glycosyltransferase family 2 protein [Nocardioides sp.]|uniref:glycosyltransferase family 2 protein n=1 Tax=Nocardioides sp. TaxID=35761 RepID=UPI003565544B